jgi:ABC-type transport system substrate-binding protein
MILSRTLIFGFPLLVGALAWWSAAESKRSRSQHAGGIVVMLPQNVPVLNPYLSATEVEREIIDLVHEPLIRIGVDGALQPALAESWHWTQDVTCWFADEATARRALAKLQTQIDGKNRWAAWHLSSARVVGSALLLNFSEIATTGVQQVLEAIADLNPRPAAFWRIERAAPLRAAWDRFVASSPLAGQVSRVWFDGEHACEIVVAGSSQRLLDELRRELDSGPSEACTLNLLGEVGALVEPVLDLDIRPGRSWHDGTPVTAEDARATLEFLRASDWPLANREAFRHIQSIETQNNGARLHVTFRKRYGPALGVFADLPMLPAAWWREHPGAQEADFSRESVPGAGNHRIATRDSRSLILVPVGHESETPRFLFNFSASPLMTQIGIRTRTVDLVWPAAAADRAHFTQLRFTPPRQRLVVLWNTRNELLKNVRFREALALATNPADLIRSVPGRLGHADASVFAPGLWFSTQTPRTAFDLERARQILADEGWPRDVNGVARRADHAFQFTLLAPSGDALHTRAAERLIAQWRQLGAQVKIEHVADARMLAQRLREHRFDAVLLDQRFEVSWDQLPWWHSAQAKPGGTNFCGIADPQIDLQLEALAGEFDPARVPERVRGLEARLLPLYPMLTLFTTHDEAAAAASLQNIGSMDAESSWTLRALTVSPKQQRSAVPAVDFKLRSDDR